MENYAGEIGFVGGFLCAVLIGFIYSKVTKKSISLPGTGTSSGTSRPNTRIR